MPTTGDFPLQLSLPLGTDPVDISVLNANFVKINDYAATNDTDLNTVNANGWVSTGRIADGAVTAVKIADGVVSATKLASTLDLTGKTVSVAAPSSGAHASTKTYTDAQDAATLASANAYADAKIPGFTVLTSGSFNGSAPTIATFSATGYRKLIFSVNVTSNTSNSNLTTAFTGFSHSYDTVSSSFGSTSLVSASAQASLNLGTTPANTGIVIEVDYPAVASRKTIVARSNIMTMNARTTAAGAITGVTLSIAGTFTGVAGTYEVVGVR